MGRLEAVHPSEQDLCGHLTQLTWVLRNDGNAGLEEVGQQKIVEADQGNVVLATEAPECVNGPDGQDLAFLCPGLSAVAAAASLLGQTTALVLLTDGERPGRLVDHIGVTVVAVPEVSVVDTVGAGDAFGGAFLAGWVEARSPGDPLSGPAVERVAAAAIQIAADTCTRTGADPPRRTSP